MMDFGREHQLYKSEDILRVKSFLDTLNWIEGDMKILLRGLINSDLIPQSARNDLKQMENLLNSLHFAKKACALRIGTQRMSLLPTSTSSSKIPIKPSKRKSIETKGVENKMKRRKPRKKAPPKPMDIVKRFLYYKGRDD